MRISISIKSSYKLTKETTQWLKLDRNDSNVLLPPVNSSINFLMAS